MTASSSMGMALVMLSVLDPGDEVIVFSPYFSLYRTQAELAGGVCVEVPTCASEGWAIDEARLRAAITPRTKLIVFNNPCNPTGMGYDRSTLELLGRMAEEYDLLIAADEIYTTYLYEGEFIPLRTLPGAGTPGHHPEQLFQEFPDDRLAGGRGHRGAGIAGGYEQHQQLPDLYGALHLPAGGHSGAGHPAGPSGRSTCWPTGIAIFYAADRIEEIPYLTLVRPKGTFYLFPGIEKTGLSAEDFCQALLERAHILVSPGPLFGSHRRRPFPHCMHGGY